MGGHSEICMEFDTRIYINLFFQFQIQEVIHFKCGAKIKCIHIFKTCNIQFKKEKLNSIYLRLNLVWLIQFILI